MITNARRKILRRYTTYPIVFGTRHSDMCHQGKLGDVSMRGMQFCSPVAIDPGDRVWIHNGSVKESSDREPMRDRIEATVCWCRKGLANDGQPFSVGVTFLQQRDATH